MRKGHTLLGFLWAGYCSFFGGTLQYYIRKEQKPVPLFLGYSLLLVSVVGYILLPLSSFWLLIPQALIMIGGTSMGVKRLLAPEDVSCGLFPFWHAEWN
ncbi:MAG: DUF6463 family protein [Odoribacter splanchnicus]